MWTKRALIADLLKVQCPEMPMGDVQDAPRKFHNVHVGENIFGITIPILVYFKIELYVT
jgi:hypothetical protein